MKIKTILALMTAAALAVGCLSGCTTASKGETAAADAAASQSASAQTPANGPETASGTIRAGKITAVDGTSVTLVLSEESMEQGMHGGMGGHGGMGQMPGQPGQNQGGENGQPPELPSGGQPGQNGPKGGFGPDGLTFGDETLTVTLEESVASGLSVGDYMMVFFDESGAFVSAEPFGRMGGPGGMGGAAASGTAAATVADDCSGETFTSETADENAIRVDGSTVTLTDLTLTKTGDGSSTEACDFYGVNAGLLAANGATVTVEGGSFTTDAAGGNALFSYGEGTTLTVKNAAIRTSSNNSGGIQTTGGATTVAENLDVETSGASAAAIRSDRGGGTVDVTGGTYVTHGTGSPAIYCTAEITVRDAALTATASEGVVVEGKNSVTLENCDLSGNMQGTYGKGSSENLQAVMIYQSMSGDASVGKGSFRMTGGSLTAEAGDCFYVTNTDAEISLSGVTLSLANGVLLRVAGNDGSRGWGAAGSNGGSATMTADAQKLVGTVVVDEISTLDLTLTGGSSWEGTVNPDGAAGRVSVKLAEGCTWKLTADAYVSAFDGDLDSVDPNGFHLYVGGKLVK